MNRASASPVLDARLVELDGIRGLAILVLTWHYIANQVQVTPASLPAYALKLLSLSWAGVDLFFVLSGFLVGGILIDNRTSPRYFRAFYARRAFRIFPLYYVMFALFIVLRRLDSPFNDPGLGWLFNAPMPMWSYSLYLQNFAMASVGAHGSNWMGITWSLAVEEQFYAVLPILIRMFASVSSVVALSVLIVLAPIVRTALFSFHGHDGFSGYVLLPGRMHALFLGVVGAWAIRKPHLRSVMESSRASIVAATLAGVSIAFGLLVFGQGIGSIGMSTIGHTVLALTSLGLILLAVLPHDGILKSVLRTRVLVWLGTVSYGIYLFHQPVAGLLHGVLRHQTPHVASAGDGLITVAALACTLLLATLSWRVFERPLVRIGQRVSYSN